MEEVGAGGSTWGSYAFCASIIRVLYVKKEIKINSTVCSIQYVNYSSTSATLSTSSTTLADRMIKNMMMMMKDGWSGLGQAKALPANGQALPCYKLCTVFNSRRTFTYA